MNQQNPEAQPLSKVLLKDIGIALPSDCPQSRVQMTALENGFLVQCPTPCSQPCILAGIGVTRQTKVGN